MTKVTAETATQSQINAAIDAEALEWAKFFKVADPEQIEARRRLMRANVAVGFLDPLLPFIQRAEWHDLCARQDAQCAGEG